MAEFLSRVAAVRRLPPRASVEARVLTRSALIDSVRQHVEREVPRDVIRNQGELLVSFGLVPPDFDYQEGAFRLLEAQLAGFYEPSDKRMYLAADLPDRAADATLAHELVHALQDQYYDLGSRLSYRSGDNDRESALQALAEGDATSAMMDLLLVDSHRQAVDVSDDAFAAEVESSMSSTPESTGVPRVLRASLVAPYVDGVLFVHALRRAGIAHGGAANGGWAAVDAAWRSPPETTEQLLHLDKYEAREPAEVLAEPSAPPGAGWTAIYDDVFGEEGLRIAIEEWMPKKSAAALAAGWAGDRAVVFRAAATGSDMTPLGSVGTLPAGMRFATAWHIRFDPSSGADIDAKAGQAFHMLAEAVAPGQKVRGSTVCVERSAIGPLAVVRAGRDVMVAAGPYRRDGNGVTADAVCKQTVRWASDVLVRSRK